MDYNKLLSNAVKVSIVARRDSRMYGVYVWTRVGSQRRYALNLTQINTLIPLLESLDFRNSTIGRIGTYTR